MTSKLWHLRNYIWTRQCMFASIHPEMNVIRCCSCPSSSFCCCVVYCVTSSPLVQGFTFITSNRTCTWHSMQRGWTTEDNLNLVFWMFGHCNPVAGTHHVKRFLINDPAICQTKNDLMPKQRLCSTFEMRTSWRKRCDKREWDGKHI